MTQYEKSKTDLNWRLFIWAYVVPIICITAAVVSIQISRNERSRLVQEAIVRNCHSVENLKSKIRATLTVSLDNTNALIASAVRSQDPKSQHFLNLLRQKESVLNEINRFKPESCELGT